MAHITIEGVPPWDGEYPVDLDYFTNRELRLIKQISDIRAGELSDEFRRGNNDLIVAVALIAALRNGTEIPVDDLWDAPVGKIVLDMKEEQQGEDPPSPTSNGNGDIGVGSEPSDRSGPGSSDTSESPARSLPATGSPGSETT